MVDRDSLKGAFRLPNGQTVPNRIAKAAMSETLGNRRHSPDQRLVRLYRRWSEGGAGLIVTGNIMVCRDAIGEPGNIVVTDCRDQDVLAEWARAGRSHGALVLAQLNHPGRQVLRGISSGVAPSAIPVQNGPGSFATPRALESAEIEEIIRAFARSAKVLCDAGFSGVQIHGAHGYLVSQFLSPLTNVRTDKWGRDIKGRSRFLMRLVDAVREQIGPDKVLAVKLNSADFQRGGFCEDESMEVISSLDHRSVDLIEISGGTYESTAFMGSAGSVKESTREREAYFLEFAEKVRERVSVPLMVTGGFRTAAGMNAAVESGAIDLVGIARPLAVEPNLARHILDGSTDSSCAESRRLGIDRFDGMADLIWHTHQIHRMAQGKDPAPNQSILMALSIYAANSVPHIIRRYSLVR